MHCSPPQQKMMADMFKEILVEIFILDADNPLQNYPSPAELQYKFIIKESRSRIIRVESPFKNSNLDSFRMSNLRFSHNIILERAEERENNESADPVNDYDEKEDEMEGKYPLTCRRSFRKFRSIYEQNN